MTGQKRFVWLAALIALLATAGCGDGDAAPQGALNSDKTGPIEQDTTPITLQLYAYNALTDEEFAAFFSDPVKKKYPHITMELVKSGQGLTP
ncbi:hypothetical protein PAESOLCIP111_05600 [Paenibacillus solanacearum]|uniref:Uncharacterized protein n=1 Tax=Paenibacillus solanacearum TaxID=2048548 RepID=A0A916NRM0_9BACL|nr:hypothetical protein [Paenibacillus solanacearum]CAG7648436.1 hypothetical protein PAESOLCIP111_05600 [Paenibacillus solanacearum]